LQELGDIEIVSVGRSQTKTSEKWNILMGKYHYLGKGPLIGAQIRYLIESKKYGYIGGLSYSSCSYHLQARDKRIGWTDRAKTHNIQKVVLNSRFLIIPQVEVKNLASYVLSKSIERVITDWQARYGYEPLLLETYVDSRHYRGTSYKASNWEYIGKTSGRTRKGKSANHSKDIYIYPLGKDTISRLCKVPGIELGEKTREDSYVDWAEEEFGSVELYDERLRERLLTIARDFYCQPGKLIPQISNGSEAKTKGAYRFFDNRKVKMEILLRPHIESTLERIKKEKIVLAVQDTTTLNYTKHYTTKGLGPIGTDRISVGLLLHDTLVFSIEGTPLGVLDAQVWSRNEAEFGKRKYRHKLPIEEKESYKWLKSYRKATEIQTLCPDTTVISIGDRESDIYELFYETAQNTTGAKLLVRAEKSKNRKVEEKRLWEKMQEAPIAGYHEVYLPGKPKRKARTAKLAIRYLSVKLEPPQGKKQLGTIRLWAVYAKEVDYSITVKEPIEWMLLTTVEVKSLADAIEKLKWYQSRWGIEVYHRTLKSGCRIEDRRLNNADSIESSLAIDMVVAWRIYNLTKQSRETPDVSCKDYLEEDEWKVLSAFVKKKDKKTNEPPTLREAVRMIAKLGGFLGRKSDGEPGTTTLWRGLLRLSFIMIGYRMNITEMREGP